MRGARTPLYLLRLKLPELLQSVRPESGCAPTDADFLWASGDRGHARSNLKVGWLRAACLMGRNPLAHKHHYELGAPGHAPVFRRRNLSAVRRSANCYPSFAQFRLLHSSKSSGLSQMTEPSSARMNGLTNKRSSPSRRASSIAASLLG